MTLHTLTKLLIMLFILDWVLLSLMLMDYGYLEWFQAIPVGLIGAALGVVAWLLKGGEYDPAHLKARIRTWLVANLFDNRRRLISTNLVFVAILAGLTSYYFYLPPLKFRIQVKNSDGSNLYAPVNLAFENYPLTIGPTNEAGFGRVELPGRNPGWLSLTVASAPGKNLEVKEKTYDTTWLLRQRFFEPVAIVVHVVPSSQTVSGEQEARQLKQEGEALMKDGRLRDALGRFRQAQQIPDISPELEHDLQQLQLRCQTMLSGQARKP